MEKKKKMSLDRGRRWIHRSSSTENLGRMKKKPKEISILGLRRDFCIKL